MTICSPIVTEFERLEFKEAFSVFDKDGDGTIKKKDLSPLLRSLGQNPPEIALRGMMVEEEENEEEIVTFPMFLAIMIDKIKKPDLEQDLIDSFQVFDNEGTGHITIAELKHVIISEFGEECSHVEEIIKQMVGNTNENSLINYNEFCCILLKE